jgi:hypothetical protein
MRDGSSAPLRVTPLGWPLKFGQASIGHTRPPNMLLIANEGRSRGHRAFSGIPVGGYPSGMSRPYRAVSGPPSRGDSRRWVSASIAAPQPALGEGGPPVGQPLRMVVPGDSRLL